MAEIGWKALQRTLDFLRLRKRAYMFTFGQSKDNEALKDLAKFCRVGTPPFHKDPRMQDILIGRQEVFFRITSHLRLSPEELHDLYNKTSSIQPKGD